MAKKAYNESNIAAIADAIRRVGNPENSDNQYTAAEMKSEIESVAEYNFSEGKQQGWDSFSDSFQNYGNRKDYAHAFAQSAFTQEDIRKLKYKVTPAGTNHKCLFWRNDHIKKIEAANIDLSGVTLSQTSQLSSNQQVFYDCAELTEIEDVGLPAGYYYYTFGMSEKLHTIAVVRSEETTLYTDAFVNNNSLRNITFEGVIGRNISFRQSPLLTIDSLKNIISHLKDYTGTGNEHTYTLTLSSASKKALQNEGTTSPNGNTWAEYIDDLKWNLA